MSEWNNAIEAAIAAAPESEAVLRGLLRDESPEAVLIRDIGKRCRWKSPSGAQMTGTIRGFDPLPPKKTPGGCYVVQSDDGDVWHPSVASVEVDR